MDWNNDWSWTYGYYHKYWTTNQTFIIDDYNKDNSYYVMFIDTFPEDVSFGIFDGKTQLLESAINAIRENMYNENYIHILETQTEFKETYQTWNENSSDKVLDFSFNRDHTCYYMIIHEINFVL